jgi:hypothetical protein
MTLVMHPRTPHDHSNQKFPPRCPQQRDNKVHCEPSDPRSCDGHAVGVACQHGTQAVHQGCFSR